MSRAENFIVRVNEHGLPLREGGFQILSVPNVQSLSKNEFAKLYWTLEAVEFEYQYRVERAVYVGHFVMEASHVPKERIYTGAILNYRKLEKDVDTMGFLNLGAISFDEESKTFSYELEFEEQDDWPSFLFAHYPKEDFVQVDRYVFKIFEREVSAYLSVEDASMSGRIDFVRAKLLFFDFKRE